jgi:23S rRNA (pseudouridine1915-N3)-methyltransferase
MRADDSSSGHGRPYISANSTARGLGNFWSRSSLMLKIRIIAIGDHKDKWVTAGCEHFVKMLKRYAAVEFKPIPSPKGSASLSPVEIKKAEAVVLLKECTKGIIIALADSGREYDSHQWANALVKWQTASGGVITFLIGGPYGLHTNVLEQADVVLSLSKLTFSHQIVRPVLLEQLYRAFSILHGTDYHK